MDSSGVELSSFQTLMEENDWLRGENQRLFDELQRHKLDTFWRRYGIKELKDAMAAANQKLGGRECTCTECFFSGRTPTDDMSTSGECKFKSYFEGLLKRYEFDYVQVVNPVGRDYQLPDRNQDPTNQTHFVVIGHNYWNQFQYGPKIWQATNVEDPVLKNVVMFFAELRYYDDSEDESDSDSD